MEDGFLNLTEGASEIAKNSTVSFKLEGWPAAAVLISIPTAVLLGYTVKTLAALI